MILYRNQCLNGIYLVTKELNPHLVEERDQSWNWGGRRRGGGKVTQLVNGKAECHSKL